MSELVNKLRSVYVLLRVFILS